ncbi:RdgB/HAM1 family non-canonical purine NTP pyrophosphatase [Asticcacaulis sp. EMRT-3]|uniref:RdgB/HAM1 family non-canonical purine NTP pyrophosphatase n=1 Tax=Asticcacaulis sp. EMRT-3 TaxID=3040349 RepID=UPI0024AFBBFC|nr:RdgB/HAM1 family non-canonical purine NTP pyrophosphatase [Asticcacaulis sp. EMRT-3]MDI7775987.1 RdgB/HAM1 family non-canonical purine NTP pyrophosphatase [Asticcacaulis sp. EMRT-3]
MSLSLITGQKLIAATHNPGKAREISTLLDGRFEVVTAASLNLPEPPETEVSFIGNAILKARHAAMKADLTALADDSGLSIDALDGDPGIYSARWAGPYKDFDRAMEVIEHKLRIAREEKGEAFTLKAHFTCALAVAWPEGHACVFEGKVQGEIVFPKRGDQGFGYDPIFRPDGHAITFAEMDPAAKDAISHRHLAFEQLRKALF